MLSFVAPEMDWYLQRERLALASSLTIDHRRALERLKPPAPRVAVIKPTRTRVVEVVIEASRL